MQEAKTVADGGHGSAVNCELSLAPIVCRRSIVGTMCLWLEVAEAAAVGVGVGRRASEAGNGRSSGARQ